MKKAKKMTVILLAAVMVLTLFPATAGAEIAPPDIVSPVQAPTIGNPTLSDIPIPIYPVGTEVVWYANAAGGVPLPSNTSLVDNTTYYAALKVGEAESTARTAVLINVVASITTVPDMKTPQRKLDGSTVADLDMPNNSIIWYATEVANVRLAPGETLVNGTYWAVQTMGWGESTIRVPVVVTVYTEPAVTGTNNPSGTAGAFSGTTTINATLSTATFNSSVTSVPLTATLGVSGVTAQATATANGNVSFDFYATALNGLAAGNYDILVSSVEDAHNNAIFSTNIGTLVVNPVPAVNSVTVSPGTASVEKGGQQQFAETVDITGSAARTVTWSVDGTDSSINTSGLLIVGANETAATLTVTAISTYDISKIGTATVTITGQPVYPILTGFSDFTGSGDRSATIDADIDDFIGLGETTVAGSEHMVDPENFSVAEGSTVITLKESYLKTFANGTYTFSAIFEDGSANLTLVVNVQAQPTPTVAPTATATATTTSTSPKTGDGANLNMWIALCMIAGVSIMGVVVWRKRKARQG